MKDADLLKVVTGFRSGILGRRSPLKMCFSVCYPLQGYLSAVGVKTKLVEGEVFFGSVPVGHYWLKLEDKRIIDPTASQFSMKSRPMPKIYLGKKPRWYCVPRKKQPENK